MSKRKTPFEQRADLLAQQKRVEAALGQRRVRLLELGEEIKAAEREQSVAAQRDARGLPGESPEDLRARIGQLRAAERDAQADQDGAALAQRQVAADLDELYRTHWDVFAREANDAALEAKRALDELAEPVSAAHSKWREATRLWTALCSAHRLNPLYPTNPLPPPNALGVTPRPKSIDPATLKPTDLMVWDPRTGEERVAEHLPGTPVWLRHERHEHHVEYGTPAWAHLVKQGAVEIPEPAEVVRT